MPTRLPKKQTVELPLFPLPNLLVYPERILPLHIFEPRYRALMRHALDGDRRFAMAVLEPGWEADYEGKPAIYSLVGIGRIAKYRELEDGRFVLHLVGESLATVKSEKSEGFRVGKLEVIEQQPVAPSRAHLLRAELERVLYEVCGRLPVPPRPECESVPSEHEVDVTTLANESILTLPIAMQQKLDLLSVCCHATRVRMLTETLRTMIARRTEMKRAERLVPQDLRWN